MTRLILTGFVPLLLTGLLQAQSYSRDALIRGGGERDRGKCTVEVVVDGAAEVHIRGTSATMRNLSGQTPHWRRFECTSPMPNNPERFRFVGIDGRGRQDLIADPRRGGAAVIRIEDSSSGPEGYTFDIVWGRGDYYGGTGADRWQRDPGYPGGYRDQPGTLGGTPRRMPADQAFQICTDEVRNQALLRFNERNIFLGRLTWDDNPGRNDWVVGTFDARRRFGRTQTYRFSCSVNFNNGRVRAVDIDPIR